jgi:flagellar assembly protein FliH
MQWSRSILKKKEAETQVLEYNPVNFQLGTPTQALNYLEAKKLGADFRLSDVVRQQTGIEEIEQQNDEQRVEDRALEKLKEIQESAYLEGRKLGLDEGRKQAFEAHGKEITARLSELSQLIHELGHMKKEILNYNEAHIIQLLFHLSSKLAQSQLEFDTQPLLNTIKSALELAQGEENITLHVSEKQIEFLEKLKLENKVEFDYLEKVKLISNSNISPGGCIVETNYGEVDAQIEQRISQLWDHLKEQMPRVKDKLTSGK